MLSSISVSLQDLRGLRTISTNGISNYRDFQRMPITKTNYKRQYLKGASNRVKSLKEECNFVQLCSDRKDNEKLFKFNQKGQLLNYRNFHLHKQYPLTQREQQNEIDNLNKINSSKQMHKNSSLKLVTDSNNQLIELVYSAEPVIQKNKKTSSISNIPKVEERSNSINNPLNSKRIQSANKNFQLIISSASNKEDLFIKSNQSTQNCLQKVQTKETKLDRSLKGRIPITFDGTKKFLKQFL
ncbi:unnamed protein product (macronuclear) [Paramecium tetraurelia]|uniref:Uncharacterized protein n=1 Tax=Paramecium tetraurelia TaxID=5888 RepID=A0E7W5_PARTE|nr:uncharacterized protein GSPATT00024110001 [Paramecium tetraurelia]CAK91382.1 unnamed protein product [Paramecium tetraurelia]|eukprot:XP_001458779.1 hypothetical protein (macronuclear) [Paramecium tetraurelia strain d4-2]